MKFFLTKLITRLLSDKVEGKRAVTSRGCIPMYPESEKDINYPKSNELNKYLQKQFSRINKHLENNDIERAVAIWAVLYQKSEAFNMFALRKSLSD